MALKIVKNDLDFVTSSIVLVAMTPFLIWFGIDGNWGCSFRDSRCNYTEGTVALFTCNYTTTPCNYTRNRHLPDGVRIATFKRNYN